MKKRPVRYISEHMGLPDDIICGASIVTVYGNNHVFIENFKSISEYNINKIKVRGKNCTIIINGHNMIISFYADKDMRIDGIIEKVDLLGG